MYSTRFAIWAYDDAEAIKKVITERIDDVSENDIEICNNVIWFRTEYNPFEDQVGKNFANKLKAEYPSIGLYMTAEHDENDLIVCMWCAHKDKQMHSLIVMECIVLESTINYSWRCAEIIDQIEKNPSWEPNFSKVIFDEDDEFDDEEEFEEKEF